MLCFYFFNAEPKLEVYLQALKIIDEIRSVNINSVLLVLTKVIY